MSTRELVEACGQLSLIQRKATEWDMGPLLVLAGPGSGKTRVLACRIACILDSTRDMNFRILALTFTNKAAEEMRSRVTSLVPGMEGRLFLGTFHSFCADVLRQHGTHLGINPNFSIYSQDNDLQAVLNDAVERAKKISDVVSDLDKKTLPIIRRLKSMLILPESSREAFLDPRLEKRISIVYPAYEGELTRRNALDFDSLILRTHQLFTKFPVLAKRYRTVYTHICVDEFQDTNRAQYALIRALTGDDYKNILVVADDDQIIYQWNGASHKRIVEFRNDYAAAVLQLPVVYRCPPEIVELANNLIRHNFLRTREKQPLEAFRLASARNKETVRLLPAFHDFESEAAGVARDIRARHSPHINSVVVLARSRKLLLGVERALHSEGLPAVISQRKDEFESTPFVWLHSILRLANDRQNNDYLDTVCGTFAQLTGVSIDPDDVIAHAAAANHDYLRQWISLMLVRAATDSAQLDESIIKALTLLGGGENFRTFAKHALDWLAALANAWAQSANDSTNEATVTYAEERLVWEELTREITETLGGDLTLEAFLQELQLRSKEPAPKPDAVILMTIHGAKGKEFNHVYLLGLVDDELPSFQSKRKGNNSPEIEEERRNCFVAITRAIESLTLSYAESYRGWRKQPSRFLFEMGVLRR